MNLYVRCSIFVAFFTIIAPALAGPINVAVDIDSTRKSGTDTTGAITTQAGFTSWDLTNVLTNGGATQQITLQGATFDIFGLAAANQSRLRASGGGGPEDALLIDFVFNEGAANRAIGLRVSGLDPGTYQMQSWHYDSDPTVTGTENFTKVEVRDQGGAATTVLSKQPFSTSPIAFQFDVSAVGVVKEIIFREDDAATATDATDQNRARLNGFTLLTVPEPTLAHLLLFAATFCKLPRQRSGAETPVSNI
jgi:hypothetical protein